jgi:A/G-specific adenine glycosylase
VCGVNVREDVVGRVLDWYETNARDLPWRRPDATPWGILVSEVMLQQTPVPRVLGPWDDWLERWPTPSALAAEPAGAAVAAWGRLGYPRRALRLHQAAVAITERHGGEVPSDQDELRALPGVGEYTAAAVASFAFGARHVVVDTNVRRVLARVGAGVADLPPSAASRRLVESYLPDNPATAARWAVASMELGALVCTARSPRCQACPLGDVCAWRAEGSPALAAPVRRPQPWHGTDRQCRGSLLAAVREAAAPVPRVVLLSGWPEHEQAERCLGGLLCEGLLHGTETISLYR